MKGVKDKGVTWPHLNIDHSGYCVQHGLRKGQLDAVGVSGLWMVRAEGLENYQSKPLLR